MKTPRVEDFDPKVPVKLPDMGMEDLPRIEKPPALSSQALPTIELTADKPQNQEIKISRSQESHQEIKKERFLDFLKPFLEMRSAGMVSFRYPQDLMDVMAEAQYQIMKRHKRKLTKNAILVAALAFVLWDYERRSEESILYTHLIHDHR
jgi:GTP cyclohydrolase FolE2